MSGKKSFIVDKILVIFVLLNFSTLSVQINKYNFSRKENQPLLLAQRQFGIIIHKSNLFRQDKFSGLIKIIT